jgi:membrane protein involved in colicin uptake
LCENRIKQKANRKQNKKLDTAFRASIIVLIIFFGIILWGCLLPESEDINNESEQSYASIEQIYQTLSADDGKIAE